MRMHFENGWGVSIICNSFSYGGNEGLSELAVLDKDGRLHYANPVAKGDVRGWLDDDLVAALVAKVESWKPDQVFPEWEDEEE